VFDEIERLLKSGDHTYIEIAATVGVEQSLVCTIAKGKHYYQVYSAPRDGQPTYLPTPEQIDSECARLRAKRKPEEDDTEVDDADGWPPPMITPGTLD
jgi:hypothetical protein